MIVVTGAGGALGGAVVERLLARVPAAQVAVSTRDPQKVEGFARRGVRVRAGDFSDPAGLAHAFEGASQVLVVSANTLGADAVARHRAVIGAAVAAGAARVLYTSHMGASPTSPFAPMPDHAATEDVLRECGVASTSLRNGFYASTVPHLIRAALRTGELRVPEDGPVAWTAHADLAEATALVLARGEADGGGSDGGGLDGPTPPLTATGTMDMTEVAALASELSGRTIHRVVVSDAEYRAGLVAQGAPYGAADMLVGLFAAARRGDFAPADPTMADLLGRPTTPLVDTLGPAVAAAS